MEKLQLALAAVGAFSTLCTILGALIPGKLGQALKQLGAEGRAAYEALKGPEQ